MPHGPNHWPRAVLFDFDGVIVNSEPLHFYATHEVLKAERVEITEDEYYRELVGFAGDSCVRFTAQDAFLRDLDVIVARDCVASEESRSNSDRRSVKWAA